MRYQWYPQLINQGPRSVVAADVEAQSNMRSTIVPGTYSLAIFGRTEYQYKDLVLKVWASAC